MSKRSTIQPKAAIRLETVPTDGVEQEKADEPEISWLPLFTSVKRAAGNSSTNRQRITLWLCTPSLSRFEFASFADTGKLWNTDFA